MIELNRCAGGIDADALLDGVHALLLITCAIVKTFEIDWIDTSVLMSPVV